MDPFIKVPPDHYGGIERVVADLADGLTRAGHEVTLWAAPGSRVNGRVEPFGREGEWTRWSNVRNTLTLAGRFLRGAARFDVIHNFGRLAYLTPVLARDVAEGADLHADRRPGQHGDGAPARRAAAALHRGERGDPRHRPPGRRRLVGDLQLRRAGALSVRRRHRSATAPLVFLGRLDRCKGAHHAITVAQRLQRRLIIAGNISPLRARAGVFRARDRAAHRRQPGHLHRSRRRRGRSGRCLAARRRC